MIRFSVIDCVEKTGTLITGIYGTIDPQPSDGMPEKTKFRAIEEAKGPAWYKHELIQLLTLNDIKCFYISDPQHPQKNLLDHFHTCNK